MTLKTKTKLCSKLHKLAAAATTAVATATSSAPASAAVVSMFACVQVNCIFFSSLLKTGQPVLCDYEYTWRDIMTGKMGGCYLRQQLFLVSILFR